MAGIAPVSPKIQFKDSAGVPLVGGTLDVYLAGTTTRTNTWQDKTQLTLNTNPIVLDSRGECTLWVDDQLTYKFVLKNVLGVTQWTVDNVSGVEVSGTLVTFTQAGTGAVQRTLQEKARESFSVDDFGATGDGTTDDYAAIVLAQTALAAAGGGELRFTPGKNYKVNTAIPMVEGITYSGGGRSAVDLTAKPGARIFSSTTDVFTNTTATLTGISFNGLWIESNTGGGHVFAWTQPGIVAKVNIEECLLVQNNANKSVIHGTSTGGIFSIWMHKFEYRYEPLNTVAAIYLASPTVNGINIDTFWSTCRTEVSGGNYSIWIESTNAGGAAFGNVVRQGTFELPGGGSVCMESCYYSGIEQCIVYDLSIVPSQPSFLITKGAGPASARCWVKGCRSKFGSAAVPDLRIDQSFAGTGNIAVDECDFLYMDGVTDAAAGIVMRGNCADNYLNMTWLTLGGELGNDLQWRSTATGSKDYSIYNGTTGLNNGYLCFEQDGSFVGAIGGSGLFQWGGTAAAPAFYVTSSGQAFPKIVVGAQLAPTYDASIDLDNAAAESFVITATNNSAFVINEPPSAITGQRISVTIRNTSGGALGAVTWNAVFKMAAWTQPADGNSRSIDFRFNGTNWVECSRTPADVPN